MKGMAAAMLVLALAATPDVRYFRYERPLENVPSQPMQTCVVADADLYAHASAQLADVRLYRDGVETPYAVHVAASAAEAEQALEPLNLGVRGGETVLDAAMPAGSYSDVRLAITEQNFLATVTVTGSQTKDAQDATKLGSYTIFDLTRQKLGRSTVLHLPPSNFAYLHFSIAGPVAPQSVTGLSVLRAEAGPQQFVTVAESTTVMQKGRTSVVEFTVAAHVPVDRVAFDPGPRPVNFTRDVSLVALPESKDEENAFRAASNGNLLRVHSVQNGHAIDEERLALDAPGADFDTRARWTVTVENGDDAPLALRAVRLQMRQRELCFDAVAGAAYALYYGDSALSAPQYDYARLFALQAGAARATLGRPSANPRYQPRPDQRPFTERHPALLWAALALVVAVLATVALRSARRVAD